MQIVVHHALPSSFTTHPMRHLHHSLFFFSSIAATTTTTTTFSNHNKIKSFTPCSVPFLLYIWNPAKQPLEPWSWEPVPDPPGPSSSSSSPSSPFSPSTFPPGPFGSSRAYSPGPIQQLPQPAPASSAMFRRGRSSCRSRISAASETGKHPIPNRFGGRFGTCSASRTAVGPSLISPPELGSPAVSISQAISRFFFTTVPLFSPLRFQLFLYFIFLLFCF